MPWPRYRPGPVEHWLGDAATEFINGFISGWRHGVGTGGGIGILTGTNSEVANSITPNQQILVSVGATAFSMVMHGVSQVSSWHEKNRFPNPFKPTGTTQPPFA